MTFDQLTIERCTLEIRYDPVYAFWDQAGLVTSSIIEALPHLGVESGTPEKVKLRASGWLAEVGLDKVVIMAILPGNRLRDFNEAASTFCDVVFNVLNVPVYNRLGCRIFYHREEGDPSMIVEHFMSLNLMTIKEGLSLTSYTSPDTDIPSPSIEHLEYSVRLGNEARGMRMYVKTESTKMEWSPPETTRWLGMEGVSVEKHHIVVDVDVYTKAPVPSGTVDLREWVHQSQQVIQTNVRALFTS